MLIAKVFDVILYNKSIDRVYFVGPEYNTETVRQFLLDTGHQSNPDIEVRQVMELKR